MLKVPKLFPYLLSAMVFGNTSDSTASAKSQVPERNEIPAQYKWQLSDIYADEQLWQNDFNKLKTLLTEIGQYKGTLSSSSENLLSCLKKRDEIGIIGGKLYAFARMHRDEDAESTKYQAMTGKTEALLAEAGGATAYIEPEVLTIPDQTLSQFSLENSGLAEYKFYFENLTRQKQHVLSPAEEEILSRVSELTQAPENIFNMLAHADMKFPKTLSDDGNELQLSEGRYNVLIRSTDRNVRKQAFNHLFTTYNTYRNTYAATLSASVKKNIFYAKTRKYNSALEAALKTENVPIEVYTNLISTVHSNLSPLHRYVALKKSALKLSEIHMYDLYTPLVQDVSMDIPYNEALTLVQDSLKPLGPEYGDVLKKGLTSGWIDVYENRGKRTGAYCWGTHTVHPFVLLNYNDRYDAVSTLTHEMGHALHSHYSHTTQPFINASYTIFSAEVASTTNEILLLDYMLNKITDKQQRLYLINQYLEQVRTTVYRQTMFAEFEMLLYAAAEKGETITADMLDDLWRELNVKYYGTDIIYDKELNVEWARIPHFYSQFYVYQYVTGYSAATALADKILNEGPSARENYLTFLKSGGSDYSLNLLKRAGVDMSSPKPIEVTLARFSARLAELEKLLTNS
ncbi:oligoendopeptidase F [Sporomusaceae bacterium FL31]|nr:oligoendopeptidase F [Sporomusaceae bacterium FL31]GCE35895.1 oligoendopeptidase F [Sporomusaceae bacterium]